MNFHKLTLSIAAMLCLPLSSSASPLEDRALVAALDRTYQAAVKANDAETMASILHDEFVLVTGTGTAFGKSDLLRQARSREVVWEQQDEVPGTQTVRTWGDTAVVTAKLWMKYQKGSIAAEKYLWFSDTYIRTPQGWKYVFGQASLELPGG